VSLRAHVEALLADPTVHQAVPDRAPRHHTTGPRHAWRELWVSPSKPKGQRDHVHECLRCDLRRRSLYNAGDRRLEFYYPWMKAQRRNWLPGPGTPPCPGYFIQGPFLPSYWTETRRGLDRRTHTG